MSPLHTTNTAPGYLQQAAHNWEFAQDIRKNKAQYLDWATTCLFYAAVHYINSYFVKFKIPIPRRHTSPDPKNPGRTNIVQQDPQLSAIYPSYRHLDDESRDARYELKAISESDFDEFLVPRLKKITDFVVPKVTV